jgi:two-component SAPR family response regulator
MIRLIVVNENKSLSLTAKLLSYLFDSQRHDYLFPREVVSYLKNNEPDLVLTNIKRPVSGNDLMSMVSELDELSRLRVFNIKLFKLNKRFRLPKLKFKHTIW